LFKTSYFIYFFLELLNGSLDFIWGGEYKLPLYLYNNNNLQYGDENIIRGGITNYYYCVII
tara:strand:- start:13 stop:195 length:183 start_codon:yes stop_codon:yes gene_type:complete